MPLSTVPHITVSSREYAAIEALYFALQHRVMHSKALSFRERNFYMDKLNHALTSTRQNEQKLANLERVQAELDGMQS